MKRLFHRVFSWWTIVWFLGGGLVDCLFTFLGGSHQLTLQDGLRVFFAGALLGLLVGMYGQMYRTRPVPPTYWYKDSREHVWLSSHGHRCPLANCGEEPKFVSKDSGATWT